MWCVAIEDFGNLTNAFVQHEPSQFGQPLFHLSARLGRSPVDIEVRSEERSHQPRPNGALMIGAIAAKRVAFVSATVLMVGWSQAAQAVRRQQIPLDCCDNAPCLFAGEHAVEQADSEDLVGSD